MLFEGKKDVVFVGMQELTAKKTGKPFHIVKVADPETFENAEFFPADKADWDTLKVGQRVKCGLDVKGQFTNLVRMS